jgi:AAA family ATP:ADP antiporter
MQLFQMKLLLFLLLAAKFELLVLAKSSTRITNKVTKTCCVPLSPRSTDVALGTFDPPIGDTEREVTTAATLRGGTGEISLKNKFFSFANIKRNEVPCFTYMSLMMFLFIYVYTTVRDTKDTLVVSNCGAESIPFLKMYGVMPSALLFIVAYSKLSLVCDKQVLFFATLLPFFAFYTIFAFVLYPNKDTIHFRFNQELTGSIGPVTNLIRFWTFSLYFIVSELWASAGVPLLFWQVANDITTISQAKRFYPLFAVTGNLAPILSGRVMSILISKQKDRGLEFGLTLKRIAMIKLGCGVMISFLYKLIYREAGNKFNATEVETLQNRTLATKTQTDSSRRKASLAESIRVLAQSKELKSIAFMVLGYNICIELTEVLWKGLLRKVYPSESEYMKYMSSFSQKVGCTAIVLQFIAPSIIKTLGWTVSSQLTPLVMLLIALPFFFSVVISNKSPELIPMVLALHIGTLQNIVNKVAKYSMFDPLKEMAYIPLGPDAKTKGKASIDVLGARLGRSTAAFLQQILVMVSGGILECAAYLAAFYVGTITLWISSVKVLGKLIDEKPIEDDGSKAGVSMRRVNG